MLIPLVKFLCCVVGVAKNVLAVPHCGIVCHHCRHLRSAILLISFLISLVVHARAGDESWTATAFSFSIPSTTSLPVMPECPRTHANSIRQMSFADTNSSIVSSTSLLMGLWEKMDCRADCESVQFHLRPFKFMGIQDQPLQRGLIGYHLRLKDRDITEGTTSLSDHNIPLTGQKGIAGVVAPL